MSVMTEATPQDPSIAEIVFPSKGVYYGDKMPGGVAQIRAWRTSEIKLLVSARNNKGSSTLEKTLDRVIDNCLILPNGMRPDDLLFSDGFYALVAQRIHTYTSYFKSEFKCAECGFKNTIWVDLKDDLSEKTPKEGAEEPIEVILPVSGLAVTLNLLRRKDAIKISKYSKDKLEKSPTAGVLGDPGYTYRIALQLQTIDGEKPVMGQKVVWLDNLHAQDLMAIENALEDAVTGVDPSVTKMCQHPTCGEENEFILPMNIEFFRPRATRPEADT